MMHDLYAAHGAKADWNTSDQQGWNVLHWACYFGNQAAVKILVENTRINLNARNSSGNTALHIAAKNGHLNIVKYLVEEANNIRFGIQKQLNLLDQSVILNEDNYMIDVLAKGLDDVTAMEAAALVGQDEIANYLAKHQKKMEHWRNRNCLFKLWLNRNVGGSGSNSNAAGAQEKVS